MKVIYTAFLLIVFVGLTHGQDTRLFADSVRSSEKTVKGEPFSAEAISETVQMLADGNKIVRRTTTRLYRDSEGRYRREDMPREIGVAGSVVEVPQSVTIVDPVGGFRFTLNPKNNTFRQSAFKSEAQIEAERKARSAEREAQLRIRMAEREAALKERLARQTANQATEGKTPVARTFPEPIRAVKPTPAPAPVTPVPAMETRSDNPNVKIETLGVQDVEGVQAEGTRRTTLIPAGAIGNERPIKVVYERWYSKELQMIVLSRNNDPRFGEQTYRLTNIMRADPPLNLFAPPADYKVIDQKHPLIRMPTAPKPATTTPKVSTGHSVSPAAKKAGSY